MTELLALVNSHSCLSQTINCAVNIQKLWTHNRTLVIYFLHIHVLSESLLSSLTLAGMCCEPLLLKIMVMSLAIQYMQLIRITE